MHTGFQKEFLKNCNLVKPTQYEKKSVFFREKKIVITVFGISDWAISWMCDKGVGNGLKHWKTSYVLYCLSNPSHTNLMQLHIWSLIWCRKTPWKFVKILWTVEKIEKVQTWPFFGHFWTNFGYVSQIPVMQFWCHCAHRSTFGCRMPVLNCIKIVWTVLQTFEIFIARSGEKRHECINSRKYFFPNHRKLAISEPCPLEKQG